MSPIAGFAENSSWRSVFQEGLGTNDGGPCLFAAFAAGLLDQQGEIPRLKPSFVTQLGVKPWNREL